MLPWSQNVCSRTYYMQCDRTYLLGENYEQEKKCHRISISWLAETVTPTCDAESSQTLRYTCAAILQRHPRSTIASMVPQFRQAIDFHFACCDGLMWYPHLLWWAKNTSTAEFDDMHLGVMITAARQTKNFQSEPLKSRESNLNILVFKTCAVPKKSWEYSQVLSC